MSTILVPVAPAHPVQPTGMLLPLYRLTVAQYHAMIAAGILKSNERVELIRGLLVCKMTKNPPHSGSTSATCSSLSAILPSGWFARAQDAIMLPDSEPEPDVAVLRGTDRDYMKRHPFPVDLGMVVEVADSSLDQDRGEKKSLYAEVRIPVYWIVNLVENQVEVYTDPSGPVAAPDYGMRQDYRPGDEVPVVIEGRAVGKIPVRDLLP